MFRQTNNEFGTRLLKQVMSKNNLFVFVGILLGYTGFGVKLAPFHVSPGGFAGLAEILNTSIGLPYLVGFWGLTLVLLIFCFRLEKRKIIEKWFTLRTAGITFIVSFLLDFVPTEWFQFAEISPLPPAIIGSFVYGVGLACIIHGNGSTGGTECIGIIVTPRIKSWLSHKLQNWSDDKLSNVIMVSLTLLFNLAVIILAGFMYGFANFLMSFLSLSICMTSIYLTISLLKSGKSEPGKPCAHEISPT
jgi:uncharacterized membrane-anchored protein YitT (DUF2179 family)